DLDLFLVHRRPDAASLAEQIWYPIWDQDIHLGHSVCTVREALQLASRDLETATALLSARHVAGDQSLTDDLAGQVRELWRRRSRRWLADLDDSVMRRHEKAGEVAFMLEPDLKEGRGGLRDVHALGWAQAAGWVMLEHDGDNLSSAYGVLLDA